MYGSTLLIHSGRLILTSSTTGGVGPSERFRSLLLPCSDLTDFTVTVINTVKHFVYTSKCQNNDQSEPINSKVPSQFTVIDVTV